METDVAKNLQEVLAHIPQGVRLVAISKFHPNEYIEAAYVAGQRIFGESREQELRHKVETLPKDIQWHFIGHLQSNKVKYIIPYITMIESVDSFKLMSEINRQAAKHNRVVDILLELHMADEETKYGFSLESCRSMLAEGQWKKMENIRICGLMMMASNVDNEKQIAMEMNKAADFFDEIKRDYFADMDYFRERSWGMSHDYKIAVRCKSTLVRIGTNIFGARHP